MLQVVALSLFNSARYLYFNTGTVLYGGVKDGRKGLCQLDTALAQVSFERI